MSPSENLSRNSSVLFGAVFLILGIILIWWSFNRDPGGGPGLDGANGESEASALSAAEFELAVEAVAATEEADFERATELWTKLSSLVDESGVKINFAVAVVKWIDTLDGELRSGRATPERQGELQQQLQEAYGLAEKLVTELTSSTTDYRAALIRSTILMSQAERLPQADRVQLLQQAAEALESALQQTPGQPLLTNKFDEIVTVLNGEIPRLVEQNKEFLYTAWKKNPRNLVLLRRSATTLYDSQDPRLKELLLPSLELTRPMWDMLQRLITRLQPEEAIPRYIAAIDQGQWDEVRALRQWLNLINSMPAYSSDGRLIDPDPLALIDTSFLSRLAPADLPDAPAARLPSYSAWQAQSSAQAVDWYDFDFDLELDVVAAHDKQLLFLKLTEEKLETVRQLELPIRPEGVMAVDLFEVQTPRRPQLPASVAELMLNNQMERDVPQAPSEEQILAGNRHDTLQELLLWDDSGIRIVSCDTDENRFFVLPDETGLEAVDQIIHIETADIEADGDLDLLIATQSGIRIFQNNGNRSFKDISQFSSLPPEDWKIHQAIACDFDRDLDQDFLLLCQQTTSVVVLENILHGQFRFRELDTAKWRSAEDAKDLDFGDFDHNGSWDWVVLGAGGSSLTTTRCTRPGALTAMASDALSETGAELEIGDVNNDGLLDLASCGSDGLWLTPGAGPAKFGKRQQVGSEGAVEQLSLVDRDYDGSLELLAIQDGKPVVWVASERPVGNFVDVRLAGINDNVGGRNNHYGLGSVLEIWAEGQLFSRAVRQPITHFGLGGRAPSNLRTIFTNGLTQNFEEVRSNVLVEEKQVLKGSCPYVYGWNGQQFELITDLLWNAPLGLQIARGQTMPDRRWEHLLLPGQLVQARDGAYELRITEELWEVAYFDFIGLTAVDHLESERVFTNEKVGPAEIAKHQIFTAGHRLYPKLATDSHGRDVTSKLQQQDRNYVQAFRRLICQGLCEPHFIELDFGALPTEEPVRLFLTGWMYPTDTSLNIAIDQNPSRPAPEPPSLWVVDGDGNWVCAQPFMGFPGGKPKSIVVDLSDVFLSDDHRLRIGSSQQIYWDEAFVSWDSGQDFRQQSCQLLTAHLHYRGFSRLLPREPDQPHWFDYQQVSTAAAWPELEGPFTRFGDVQQLLTADDDRLLVMTSGDEIILRFELPQAELPTGWSRDFVLHCTGWDKDADINTLAGQGSLPLPFKNQQSYPPPLEQSAEAANVWLKNADTLTRERQVSRSSPIN